MLALALARRNIRLDYLNNNNLILNHNTNTYIQTSNNIFVRMYNYIKNFKS